MEKKILIKIASNKDIIGFSIYNYKVDRALTFKMLKRMASECDYCCIFLEEIFEEQKDIVAELNKSTPVMLVCDNDIRCAEQAEIANSIGIGILPRVGEIGEYLRTNFGESIEYRGNNNIGKENRSRNNVKNSNNTIKVVSNDYSNDEDETDGVDKSNNGVDVERVVGAVFNRDELHETEQVSREVYEVEKGRAEDLQNKVNEIQSKLESKENEVEVLKDNIVACEDEIGNLKNELKSASENNEKYLRLNESLQNNVDALENSSNGNEDVDKLKKELADEHDSFIKSSNDLVEAQRLLDDSNTRLNEALEELQNKKAELAIAQSSLAEKQDEYNTTIDELREAQSKLSSIAENDEDAIREKDENTAKISELQNQIELITVESTTKINGLNAQINEFESDVFQANNRVNEITGKLFEVRDEILRKIEEIPYRDEVKKLVLSGEDGQELDESNSTLDINNTISIIKNITKLIELIVESKNEVASVNKECDAIKADIEKERAESDRKKADEFSSLTQSIEELTNRYNVAKNELSAVKLQVAEREKMLNDLIIKVDEYKGREEELNRKLSSAVIENSKLKLESREAADISGATRKSICLPCNYTGKAKIICVYGSGGNGTTTMAMTIRQRLFKSRVLFVDFDLKTPTADRWFSVAPIRKEICNDGGNVLKKTAVGALLSSGVEYVLSNYEKIVIRLAGNGTSCCDYFGGIYYTEDNYRVFGLDFSILMNYLGMKYDYIIVDCGSLGASYEQDTVIRTLSNVSWKDVVVTQSLNTSVRGLSYKVKSAHIDESKQIWVLNMADSNVIKPEIYKYIPDCKKIQIIKSMSYFGINKAIDIAETIYKENINMLMRYIEEPIKKVQQ